MNVEISFETAAKAAFIGVLLICLALPIILTWLVWSVLSPVGFLELLAMVIMTLVVLLPFTIVVWIFGITILLAVID